MMTTKIPQADLQAERSTLGAILIDKPAFAKCSEYLTAESFYDNRHATIYRAMIELDSRNEPIDLVTVEAELTKRKEIEGVGQYFLMDIDCPFPRNVETYAKIVQDKALLRKFASISEKSSEESYKPDADIDSLLDKSIQNLFALQQGTSTEGFESQGNMVREFMVRQQSKIPTGISTGYEAIDAIIGGLKNSELIILGGRPGIGKTSLGLNVAFKALSHSRGNIALVSIEMGKGAIQNRFISALGNISLYKVTERMGLTEGEQKRVAQIDGSLLANLHADYSHTQTIPIIRARARKLKSTTDLKLLVIDYLQIITPSTKSESRAIEVGGMCKELKSLAKELDIPILCLAQVNRDLTKRTDPRPVLNDLKDSGGVEENADMVLFVHRQAYYDKSDDNTAEVIVAKNRNGRTGTANLTWQGDISSFIDKAPPKPPPF